MRSNPIYAKLLFLIFGGALSMGLLAIGAFQLIEFSDSVGFCGRLCHNVMKPEYTAYQDSPHSRVLCVNCHVGPGTSYFVKSKITGIPLVWATITGHFDRPIPIPVRNLRPARETCEQCHRPERFAGDLVRTHITFAKDEANTQKVDTRIMHVGGGQAGIAQNIHWHVAARVWYLPLDEKRQNIGWVGVEQSSGTLVEYNLREASPDVTQEKINKDKRLMDCIDCHNRATHVFRSPDDLTDESLSQGLIDSGLPFIKREIVSRLDPPNSSTEAANSRLEEIRDFYRTNYSQVAADKGAAIDQAISEAKRIATLTTFPEMHVTWDTYPNNIGHANFANVGCFRCHGRLVATNGDQAGKPIDQSCTLCHSQIS